MGKKNQNVAARKLQGREGFEEYYGSLFNGRWRTLKESLFGESVYACWKAGGNEPYYLDPASVFAALQLPLEGAEHILDMCAAPGGKTLVIASRMAEDAELVSNERSPARKNRLAQVVQNCLPEEIRNRIKISCSDGAKWCTTQTEVYDRILLDAPCSSERHVLADEKYLSQWSPSRIKSLSMEQWALLSSAYRLLVPGGYLLYSTCALCPSENDGVVSRLFKKFSDAELCFTDSEPAVKENIERLCSLPSIIQPERTEYGFHILPDKSAQCGPIWFTLIHKKQTD